MCSDVYLRHIYLRETFHVKFVIIVAVCTIEVVIVHDIIVVFSRKLLSITHRLTTG